MELELELKLGFEIRIGIGSTPTLDQMCVLAITASTVQVCSFLATESVTSRCERKSKAWTGRHTQLNLWLK